MNDTQALRSRPFVLAIASVAVLALQSWTLSEAQARERAVEATGPQGQSVKRMASMSEGQASRSVTGPAGKSLNRQSSRTDNGFNATVTGPQGETGSVEVTRKP